MISSLKGNNTLEKLELEGNILGPKTAKALGLLLRTNTTLKHVNIENNNLTLNGEDVSGVRELARVSEYLRFWGISVINYATYD